jgi:alkyl hydroperoxide reductase subunit AhpC
MMSTSVWQHPVKARVTLPAPAFSGMAFAEGTFKKLSLADYSGKYVVLFFYPLDFTFVCPTEICAFNDAAAHFKDVGCEVIACSVDSHFTHMEYTKKPRSEGGLGDMDIPMLSDLTKTISSDYGVLTPDGAISFRGTFIIDKSGILRHSSVNDLPVGRNPDETLRLVKAFQHVDEHGEVCPANWNPGKKAMDASHTSEKTQKFWQEEHAK